MQRRFFCLLAVCFVHTSTALAQIEPKEADYSKLAFYPDRWVQHNVPFGMHAWHGKHIVLLTNSKDMDPTRVAPFVSRLDGGWEKYAELTGATPQKFRILEGRTPICALPRPDLSCGYGCGYVGATGVEVAGFYNNDWPAFQKDPDTFSHYYFYELGRNFYTFEDRHSLYVTGYAVFMRYVCMDHLKCKDPDIGTRTTIERCEGVYAASDIRFLDAFTNLTNGEKGDRLKDPKTGRMISPSDQPVMYATAMLKLRKDHGGDEWLKKFYGHLQKCPQVKPTDEASALRQSLNWLVSASAAAGQDLSSVFVDRWRMPLSSSQRQFMKTVKWNDPALNVVDVLEGLNQE